MLDRISRSSQVQLRAYGFEADFRELLNCFALNGILKKRFLFSNKHNALFYHLKQKKDVKTSNFLLINNLKPRHVLHNSRLTSIYTQYKMNLWGVYYIYILPSYFINMTSTTATLHWSALWFLNWGMNMCLLYCNFEVKKEKEFFYAYWCTAMLLYTNQLAMLILGINWKILYTVRTF